MAGRPINYAEKCNARRREGTIAAESQGTRPKSAQCCTAFGPVLANRRFRGPTDLSGSRGKKSLQFQGLTVPRPAPSASRKTLKKQGAASITVKGENGIVSGMAGRYATALF